MQTDRGQRSFTVHCFNPTAALPVHFDDHGWATNCCISAGLRWQKEPAGEGKYRKNKIEINFEKMHFTDTTMKSNHSAPPN